MSKIADKIFSLMFPLSLFLGGAYSVSDSRKESVRERQNPIVILAMVLVALIFFPLIMVYGSLFVVLL